MYWPSGHGSHTRHRVWPWLLWYVPGWQGWHSDDVLLGLKVPSGHGTHVASVELVQLPAQLDPAGQVPHVWHLVPAIEAWYLPASHVSHTVAPEADVNVPTEQ
jgi:hypothetical protein